MSTAVPAPPPVAIRVDALRRLGVGHVIRQLALAEELTNRGRRVRLFGATDVPFAAAQVEAAGLAFEAAPEDPDAFAALLVAEGIGTCIVDGYEFAPALGAALRASGIVVATLCDAEFGRDQVADLYVDQNLGAVARPDLRPGRWLAGLEYAVLRDVVRYRRTSVLGERPVRAVPRVLVLFGGTDPYGGAPVYAAFLAGTKRPIEIVAVAANAALAERLRGVELAEGQTLELHPPVDDLPGLAATCDAAVSASGTSVWELACLGIPTALVCVTANQLLGYRAATQELCLPAGELENIQANGRDVTLARRTLKRLVSDADLRRTLSSRASAAVDGRGRERVVDALEELEQAGRSLRA